MKYRRTSLLALLIALCGILASCSTIEEPKFNPAAYNAGRAEEARRNPIPASNPYLATAGWIETKNEKNGTTRINPGTGEFVSSAYAGKP